MPIDKTKITKEMLGKAAQCQTAEELMALVRQLEWRSLRQKPRLIWQSLKTLSWMQQIWIK